MRDERPVVVLSELDDLTADLVIAELHRRSVPVVRMDSADFPQTVSMSAHLGSGQGLHGQITTSTRRFELSAVRSLYYRRPTAFAFPGLNAQDARFAQAQARHGFGGVLATLPGCLYVNHPHTIADADFKVRQLSTAVEVGFEVPASLVTNDLDEAQAFAEVHGQIVYKPLREVQHEAKGQPRTVWVSPVRADEIDATVRGTAHLFQALVHKIADLRVTVVGERVFCVRIDSDPPLVDWRYDYDRLSYSLCDLPKGLVSSALMYLKRLGLIFGCFDFALTAAGTALFLECNPNGQWSWLAEHTGAPIAAAFADVLERGLT